MALRRVICAVVLGLATATPAFAAERNHCHDPAAEAEWQALLAKDPADYRVQALHALRIGLCVKVDRGALTVIEATTVFEKARRSLVAAKHMERVEKGLRGEKKL